MPELSSIQLVMSCSKTDDAGSGMLCVYARCGRAGRGLSGSDLSLRLSSQGGGMTRVEVFQGAGPTLVYIVFDPY